MAISIGSPTKTTRVFKKIYSLPIEITRVSFLHPIAVDEVIEIDVQLLIDDCDR